MANENVVPVGPRVELCFSSIPGVSREGVQRSRRRVGRSRGGQRILMIHSRRRLNTNWLQTSALADFRPLRNEEMNAKNYPTNRCPMGILTCRRLQLLCCYADGLLHRAQSTRSPFAYTETTKRQSASSESSQPSTDIIQQLPTTLHCAVVLCYV